MFLVLYPFLSLLRFDSRTERKSYSYHVSVSAPAKGMTNTVMSSPDPSLSLGSRHPRSFRTPRDLIRRSWAANVYLWHTKTAIYDGGDVNVFLKESDV